MPPGYEEIVVSGLHCYNNSNGCSPTHYQYVIAASASGGLLLKENEWMNHLLTIMEISTQHIDKSYLQADLQLIKPSQSYINADSLRNFWLLVKNQIIALSDGNHSTAPFVTKQIMELIIED